MKTADPREIFQQEAQDLLVQLEQALLDLEHAPDDSALIDTAFRALHTIKGSGSMFGFEAVAAFTHHVETAFDKVRQGTIAPNRELIMVTLRARDHMRQLIEAPESADTAAGEAILAQLHRAMEGGAPQADVAPAASAASSAIYRVRIRFPRDVMATGTNPLLLLDEVRGLGRTTITPLTDDVPPLDVIDPTACHIGWDVMLTTAQPRNAIEDVFLFVRDEMTLEIEPVADAPAARLGEILTGRGDVTAGAVQAALEQQQRVGELLVQGGATSPDKVDAALAEQQHVRRDAAPKSGSAASNANSSVRVPAERLGELMDRVGELVIAQSRLRQIATTSADQQVKSVAEEIERLVLELRDTTMGIRMVPIGSLFGRFRRVVHDLSRDLGKEVALTMEGEETELDKTVIEQLNDPLVHLIRNAIDHGLEDPAGRAGAGKSPQGTATSIREAPAL